MKQEDYPGLYIAASRASKDAQDGALFNYKLNAFLLILAALLNMISIQNSFFALISAILFLGSLLTYIYGRYQDFQGKWYKARALAESIKSGTWRLMIGAEPFNAAIKEDNINKFIDLLNELLIDNKGIASQLSGEPASMQLIPNKITNIMDATFEVKRDFYLEERIKNQRTWYASKSGFNYKSSKNFFISLCIVYGFAIALSLLRIAKPELLYLPIDVVAVIASVIIGWTQIKRFDELTSSYSLTAYEIGIIEGRFRSVNDIEHLSRFVSDAENAFSREHTQWAARRDH